MSVQENRWLRCLTGGRKEKRYFVGGTLRCRLRLPVLWHRALAAIHGWFGHLARGKESDLGAAAVR